MILLPPANTVPAVQVGKETGVVKGPSKPVTPAIVVTQNSVKSSGTSCDYAQESPQTRDDCEKLLRICH